MWGNSVFVPLAQHVTEIFDACFGPGLNIFVVSGKEIRRSKSRLGRFLEVLAEGDREIRSVRLWEVARELFGSSHQRELESGVSGFVQRSKNKS